MSYSTWPATSSASTECQPPHPRHRVMPSAPLYRDPRLWVRPIINRSIKAESLARLRAIGRHHHEEASLRRARAIGSTAILATRPVQEAQPRHSHFDLTNSDTITEIRPTPFHLAARATINEVVLTNASGESPRPSTTSLSTTPSRHMEHRSTRRYTTTPSMYSPTMWESSRMPTHRHRRSHATPRRYTLQRRRPRRRLKLHGPVHHHTRRRTQRQPRRPLERPQLTPSTARSDEPHRRITTSAGSHMNMRSPVRDSS